MGNMAHMCSEGALRHEMLENTYFNCLSFSYLFYFKIFKILYLFVRWGDWGMLQHRCVGQRNAF